MYTKYIYINVHTYMHIYTHKYTGHKEKDKGLNTKYSPYEWLINI